MRLVRIYNTIFSSGHDKRIYMKTLNEDDIRKQEEYIYCDREDYLGEARPNTNISLQLESKYRLFIFMGWRKYVACDSTKSLITFYRGRFTLGLISDTILEDLTSYDVRHLIMMEDENTQTKVVELAQIFHNHREGPYHGEGSNRGLLRTLKTSLTIVSISLRYIHRMFFCCPHSLISSNDYFCLMMEK